MLLNHCREEPERESQESWRRQTTTVTTLFGRSENQGRDDNRRKERGGRTTEKNYRMKKVLVVASIEQEPGGEREREFWRTDVDRGRGFREKRFTTRPLTCVCRQAKVEEEACQTIIAAPVPPLWHASAISPSNLTRLNPLRCEEGIGDDLGLGKRLTRQN